MNDYKEKMRQIKTSKITGFSFPWFGLSWEIAESEKSIITKIISYLEDRRVLFLPYEPHMKKTHCIQSVLNIREYLSEKIEALPPESPLIFVLKHLRASCRKFLVTIEPYQKELDNFPDDVPNEVKFIFSTALGELRASFGIAIALFSEKFDIEINDDFSSILPIKDS
jgi:hypothetical protein